MDVAVLVPRRSDGGHRDRLWEFARNWWLRQHPDWPIFEGHHEDGPFNRSAAINDAHRQAGPRDGYLIIDGDMIANPDAVREAVAAALASGRLAIPHHTRQDLTAAGTEAVMAKPEQPWRRFHGRAWSDSVSCCVAVPGALWDLLGGFDPLFVGWGREDSAFAHAAEVLVGPMIVPTKGRSEPADRHVVYHLWHPLNPEGAKSSPLRAANDARLARYQAADEAGILSLLDDARREQTRLDDGGPPVVATDGLIPRIFHRTVPETIDPQLEQWWEERRALHPSWEFRTYRDPIDVALFPRTAPLWNRCETGAQKADLIRLEALAQWGGVYVDADCRPVGSHEPLRSVQAYAAWEDETTIPNAVMGAVPGHPAIEEALDRSIAGVKRRRRTYDTGVAITTQVFRGRDDMLILPPGSFYPHHYLAKAEAGQNIGPWVIEEHMWHHSWGDEKSKASIEARQR